MEEINYEEFFKREFENRYMIDIPCEDIEDGCVENHSKTAYPSTSLPISCRSSLSKDISR